MTDYAPALKIRNEQLKNRYNSHLNDDNITNLNGEIALLRLALENVVLKIRDNIIEDSQIVMIAKLVGDITDSIEKMTKIETRMDLYVKSNIIDMIFARIQGILEKNIENPTVLEQIGLELEQISYLEHEVIDV